MLSAFKIKEFDLQPIYEEWKDGPVFNGNPKKDLPVEEWLEKIKTGCQQRGVPEEYWYKVAQHFMGPKAKARLDELKQVIVKVHGGKYRWTWKKFTVAMMNMGWAIDKDKKMTIKIQGRPSWFTRRRDTEASSSSAGTSKDLPPVPPVPAAERSKSRPPPPSRSNTSWFSRGTLVDEPEPMPEPANAKDKAKSKDTKSSSLQRSSTMTSQESRGRHGRSATVSGFWPGKMSKQNSSSSSESAKSGKSKDDKRGRDVVPAKQGRPPHQKAKSDSSIITKKRSKSKGPAEEHQDEAVTKAEAPAWLLNACTALEFITSEHPKAMSIISAILITAGSIPAIPAIAAGAGGAVLASSAAHAIGAIAVGVGQALSAGVAHSQKGNGGGSGSGGSH